MTIQDVVCEFFRDERIVKVSININPELLKNKNLTLSKLHRLISNSKQVIGKKTNREFWKEITTGGLYYTTSDELSVSIVYLLNPKIEFKDLYIHSLKSRIKKIIWSQIEIQSQSINFLKDFNSDNFLKNDVRLIGHAHSLKNEFLTT